MLRKKSVIYFFCGKKKRILNQNFLEILKSAIELLTCTGLLKKKQSCEKLILKIRVKVSVHLPGPSTHVSAMANYKGTCTHTPMHFFFCFVCFFEKLKKKVEKGKVIKLLNIISELISGIDIPEI